MAEPTIYAIARRFREELLRQERAAAMEMARRYGEIWRRIKARLDDLGAAYAALEEPPGPGWLFEQRRLEDLQRQVEAEMAQYAAWVEQQVCVQQEEAIRQAAQMGQAMGLRLDWGRLNTQALQDIVGFTQEGSPLRELLDELGAEASEAIRRELIAGLALGKNPAETARQIRSALGGNLVRALRISRTETLRAFREATLRGYQEDDNVARWQWVSAKSERTCAACLAMDGTVHPLSERLDDHPNGRCVMVPVLKGEKPAQYETGEEWFARQQEEVQRKVLGKAGLAAYRAGAIDLHSLVAQHSSPEWGSIRSTDSLSHALERIVRKIRSITTLPALEYHLTAHGEPGDLGVSSRGEYLARLARHVARDSLEFYVTRRRDGSAMWYAVDLASHEALLYNESRGRAWSFFRIDDVEKFLANAPVTRVLRVGRHWVVSK